MNRASGLNMDRWAGIMKEGKVRSKERMKTYTEWRYMCIYIHREREIMMKGEIRKVWKEGRKEGRKEEGRKEGAEIDCVVTVGHQPSRESSTDVANTALCLHWERPSTHPPTRFVALLFAFSFLWREPLSVKSQPFSIPPLSLTPPPTVAESQR